MSHALRVEALVAAAGAGGGRADPAEARGAFDRAWARQLAAWARGTESSGRQVAAWALSELGASERRAADLAAAFAEASLASGVTALEGARDVLERLAAAGVRRGLVCDTGLVPGRVVQQLLDAAGLLELLEVCVFSDEVGAPKPHPRGFQQALGALAAAPGAALHVGDLRRTDVAGGRGAGMATVRLRCHFDDASGLAEADRVADSHAHLLELLDLG